MALYENLFRSVFDALRNIISIATPGVSPGTYSSLVPLLSNCVTVALGHCHAQVAVQFSLNMGLMLINLD